jgi:uncharacterized protein (DUF1778 family)
MKSTRPQKPKRQTLGLAKHKQALTAVSPKGYAEFLARLNAPARPNKKLRRTMRTLAPWERA